MTENADPQEKRSLLRRLYDWILEMADTRYAVPALAVLSFAESSFFPIPPDVLLLAMCLGAPRHAFRFALICSVFSVLGGIGGYYIGYAIEPVGRWIITNIASPEKFDVVADMYGRDAFFFITVAAFTPIPYKVFTIAAGMFHESVPLSTLIYASVIGRTARFFLVAGLVYKYGPPVRQYIERYFDRLMWAFVIILVLGFGSLKFLGDSPPLGMDETYNKLNSNNVNVRVIRLQQVEKESGSTFGLDTAHRLDDKSNAAGKRLLQEWFQTKPDQEEGD